MPILAFVFRIAILATLILAPAIASAQVAADFYAASPTSNNVGLWRIDADANTVTFVGPYGFDGLVIRGLAYDPVNVVLYGTDGGSSGPFNQGGETSILYSINILTGAASVIGDMGVKNIWGLAFDPATDQLFGITRSAGNALYLVDVETAAATLIGPMLAPDNTGELTILPLTGELLATTDNELYSVSRNTGEATLIGAYGLATPTQGPDMRNIAFDDSRNMLFGIDGATSGSAEQRLFVIDPTDATPTLYADLPEGRGFLGMAAILLTDSDSDGIPDPFDECPETGAELMVDGMGCTLPQFCATFDASTNSGSRECRFADWLDDEPDRMNPRDCRGAHQPMGGRSCIPFMQ